MGRGRGERVTLYSYLRKRTIQWHHLIQEVECGHSFLLKVTHFHLFIFVTSSSSSLSLFYVFSLDVSSFSSLHLYQYLFPSLLVSSFFFLFLPWRKGDRWRKQERDRNPGHLILASSSNLDHWQKTIIYYSDQKFTHSLTHSLTDAFFHSVSFLHQWHLCVI